MTTKVQPHQVWETRTDANSQWCRVKVVNVSLDTVELEYLDAPGEPDIKTSITTTQSAMLASESRFRFLHDVP
jgi:hypothetical protein